MMRCTARLAGVSLLALVAAAALADGGSVADLPTGFTVTPLAAPGSTFQALNPGIASDPAFVAGQAETTALSPDGKTLLVLTSGFNLSGNPDTTGEWVFVFDLSSGSAVQSQALKIANAFSGLAWSPDSATFYAAGGQDDDVHVFTRTAGVWAESGTPIALNHTAYGVPIPSGNGLYSLPGFGTAVSPLAAGLAVTADGKTLIVANLENDSLSLIDTGSRVKTGELDLRPGRNDPAASGKPGGEFPFWLAVRGSTVYVSSQRDRQIVVVALGPVPAITNRISVPGNPNRMALNKAGTRLYVTADNADLLEVIDTRIQHPVASVNTLAPAGAYAGPVPKGASPNSVALSPDERTAYVTNGGANSIAVIDVSGAQPTVAGLIPTGWYPNSVSVSADGKTLYVATSKSPTGPNPGYLTGADGAYDLQLLKGGFGTIPVPGAADLATLTGTVLANDHIGYAPTADQAAVIAFLKSHIKHVIYIVKENRTYDQILGDLPVGNGDASLTQYPQAITPNFHAIAGNFVDLDNFYTSGEVSMDGWQWSTAGRGVDLNEKVVTVNYGKGGGSYDSEGTARGICVGIDGTAARVAADPVYGLEAAHDPDVLPGTANEVGADGPSGEKGAGYLWNAVLRAGLSYRNYGFLLDLTRYSAPSYLGGIGPIRDPHASKTRVAWACDPTIIGRTDPFFRGFDNVFPDFYRYREWAREFDILDGRGVLPAVETVRLMHDHTGNFGTAIDGVNTPELQQADNDYAVGLLVDKIAHSDRAGDTLVFVLEDDSQDGPDHVDTHRSTGYIVGPYVKQGAVVSTRYATVNLLRTIGDVLGLPPLSLNVASAAPMTDVFDIAATGAWNFNAVPSSYLANTQLPIPSAGAAASAPKPRHDAAWWAARTKGMNFSVPDALDESAYNRLLWQGTMGDKPYPADHGD